MRDEKELNSAEFNDDLQPLKKLLEEKGADFIFKRHNGASPEVKSLIGYYPAGEWQIIIDGKYSVIRGRASYGLYEIMNIKDGKKFADPERFETPEELFKSLS